MPSIIASKNKSNNNKNYRILIVDDEFDIALAFKIGLEDHGFIVDAYNDSREALINFKKSKYDLLLLDIKMPKLNGIECYLKMKQIDSKVKICFITASETFYYENLITKIFDLLSTRSLFRKPIKLKELINALNKELNC
jgi:DNA-binding response OmpR family regulator